MSDNIEALLEKCLSIRWGQPVSVSGLKRFHGGAARETYRFDATSGGTTRGLVLRRDPASSLIETDRRTEFAALAAVHGSEVPVPEPLFVDESGAELGAPGFIMSEVADVKPGGILTPDAYAPHGAWVGEQMFTILGHIHAADPAAFVTGTPPPAPEDCWRQRLDHWAAAVTADALGPEPIFWAGVRWLERNPPPTPSRLAIVHGDYRSGNFLVDDNGRIGAIVDWEMAHIGDPLEDLAWAMDPLWSHGSPGRPAGTVDEATAIAHWRRTSGLTVDPTAFAWWRVYAQVMGLAIWISSAREVASGRSIDPIMVFSSLYTYRFHNRTLAATLRSLAA
ncbi:phosphotransferase family protein [Sphingoaurantiacus capsulatus]|uniref:Phosphotransferase family protein n=1 Tax=Sphingoaurantiacus capsulatus TaxID=1771310 RepID=A0ABV7X7Z6_9SPHN